MSRRYNIRWNENDSKEITRVVKNFNAKIDRLAKKSPENKSALPDKVTVRQLKELVDTRQDLNRELNSLRRFSKRGAEDIVKAPQSDYNLTLTKWQRNEMSRRVGIINRKRNQRLKEISDIEMTSRGESLGYSKGQFGMGKADEVALKPLKAFTPKMTRKDLNKKFKTILNESQSTYWNKRDVLLKENYIKSLTENFNPDDVKEIIDKIQEMDFKSFRKVFEAEGGNFETAYPPDEEQYDAYLSSLKSTWIPNKKSDAEISDKKD